jgi:hypothetical protein
MFVTEITPTKTARVELSLDATSPLPDSYGDDRLVMIARDPNTFFAYWEITPERTEHIRSIHGPDSWENAALVLRVYDLGVAQKTPIDSASHFDAHVDPDLRQGYVQVPKAGHFYCADLGLLWSDRKFVAIVRSNTIGQPSGQVSEYIDGPSMSVTLRTEHECWEKMAGMAMGAGSSKGVSNAGESGNVLSLRWEFLRSVFSGSASRWPSSMPGSKMETRPVTVHN